MFKWLYNLIFGCGHHYTNRGISFSHIQGCVLDGKPIKMQYKSTIYPLFCDNCDHVEWKQDLNDRGFVD